MAMTKLTHLLLQSPAFQDPMLEDFIPLDQQDLFLKLAEEFQKGISSLYLDPDELAIETRIGTPEVWEEFLNIEAVRLYVAARTKNLATVQARKAMKNLQKSANNGDVAAIKYLNDVSGLLHKQADNKQIVLHYVPRPTIHKGVTQ